MNIIQQARDFVQRLLNPHDPRRCPRCKKKLTKKNGTRRVIDRSLGGVQPSKQQNWWCHYCGKSYYVEHPQREKWARYPRGVKRKALDMYVHLGGSLRGVAEWMRAEINPGTGRAKHWEPWSQPTAGPQAKLSHTTVWRWLQAAGAQAEKKRSRGGYRGIGHFSGALVADGTGVKIRGASYPVHLICDGVSRVGMRLQRLAEESEVAIRGQFWALVQEWGLTISQIRVLISDGAAYYRAVLEGILRQARQQRSLFHLWRNILPAIRSFGRWAGREGAQQFRAEVKGLWNAESLSAARQKQASLQTNWGAWIDLQEVIGLIEKTLEEALTHTLGIVEGMGRTSNVAERFFRRYKQRVARMGCFMSFGGCDHFNAVWEVYINFEPYQVRREKKKRYCYPGLCPFQVGGVETRDITWLDAIGI